MALLFPEGTNAGLLLMGDFCTSPYAGIKVYASSSIPLALGNHGVFILGNISKFSLDLLFSLGPV